MVKLVEIEEESVYDGDSQYTTDSELESLANQSEKDYDSEFDEEDEDDYLEESFLERIAALKDIVPVEQRRVISSTVSSIGRWGGMGISVVGKLGWIFTTSALLVVFPLAIESDREKMMQQWEAEQGMQGQMNAPPAAALPGMPGAVAPGLAPGLAA
ncbi:mitochondrial outer membrane translocase complex, subunit Tom22 [Kickxella alabastrina]|uniref:mitochondrial outer membrane translocase complex, subunit Tom22 n=1 Tax=Kickxella alabastrina TaxID=61397 RepID=UPI002220D895|nr:mitochondrial outer membrane translocase complex, subunit Tom22 [Kickxella alabastrina]KAI7826690.1 mitochondrial outer membrane translocase complex, subunit Tom22 [Kickxella alabastrina]